METKKVAFLVDVAYRTRVVIDVPEDFDEETDNPFNLNNKYFNQLVEETDSHIVARINNRETAENIIEIEADYEVPYDPELDK